VISSVNWGGETRVGLAYSPGVYRFVEDRSGLVDYIEIPFEQFRSSTAPPSPSGDVPTVLHCASLSVAGFVAPRPELVDSVAQIALLTRTPWIGEHLAFLSADPLEAGPAGRVDPTELTYTVCPQLSNEVLRQTTDNITRLQDKLPVPLILENSPQYFVVPGSTMTMVEFIRRLVDYCDVGLLLDLSHYEITASNLGFTVEQFDRLPLERIVEVHMSGYSTQSGITWDDHSAPASESSFSLLERLLERVRPQALTFEYNWGAFPESVMENHIARGRRLVGM
jgi:uncharacterized protein